MGANAQTAVPVFTAGQVLTAQQQTEINTGIPVFATTVTRDAAFGGTGEKTLAEGQFAYIEATNTTQYYDGAAWQSVGVSGLTLVSTVTIAAASTTNVNNCFTSTYKNYLLQGELTTSANTPVSIRMRVGGADNTTSNYNITYHYSATYTASAGDSNSSTQTAFNLQISNVSRAINMNMFMQSPQATEQTTIAFNNLQADNGTTNWFSFIGGGAFVATTSFDGFSIFTNGVATLTGSIKIYGLGQI